MIFSKKLIAGYGNCFSNDHPDRVRQFTTGAVEISPPTANTIAEIQIGAIVTTRL